MTQWQEYHLPETIDEAVALLARFRGDARVIGGGTDLILDLNDGRHEPVVALIDVTRIPEMNAITLASSGTGAPENDWVLLGAAATHDRIVRSALLQEQAACLVESCGVIGGPQVRNVATIGGNVAHALPAADGTVSLLALGAEGLVASLGDDGGIRRTWRPLPQLFLGPGKSAINASREVLVGFRFLRRQAREASAFERIMRPQGVALPILGVAARVRLSQDGRSIGQAQIAIGPAGPVPFRASAAEALLSGAPANDPAVIDQAVAAARAEARLRTSKHRASAEYRSEMLSLLLRRVLGCALARADEAG